MPEFFYNICPKDVRISHDDWPKKIPDCFFMGGGRAPTASVSYAYEKEDF